MSNEMTHIELRFEWPAAIASENYDAGDESEIQYSFSENGVAVPLPGETLLFDHPDTADSDMMPTAGGRTNKRFIEAVVDRREFSYQVSRYGNSLSRYQEITLHLRDVREWSP